MKYLRKVETDAEAVSSYDYDIFYYSTESKKPAFKVGRTYFKVSANGEGEILVNQGYINTDGFTDSYDWFYERMDSSNDRELSGTTYYAYDCYGYVYYLTEDLSTYSKGDTIECTIYWDNEEECDGSADDTIIVNNKYVPNYRGTLQQTLTNQEGENQTLMVSGDVVSLYANSNSTITAIEMPKGMKKIIDYAFAYCTSLTSVTIPNSVTSIGSYTFKSCSSLSSITIPNSVTSIGDYTFFICTSLTSVTIPNSVTSIGTSAFYNCTSLTSVTIPNSVTSIGDSAFQGCGFKTIGEKKSGCSIEIPYNITTLNNNVFYNCNNLVSVTIPNTITSIGIYAFGNCDVLSSVTIPNSVTSIGEWAFAYTYSLKSITIPNSVTSFGEKSVCCKKWKYK